ncbi:hypothetical protein IJ00_05130 [Calothrix sp. 336/3]|nr:hypothetical protein IJ00_05130 [Calothrix sp. 336/3]
MSNLILVVDDDVLLRTQMSQLLTATGYQVAEASNGVEALSLYTQLQPDMLLLNAQIPEIDGFQVCEQVRSLPGGQEIPVLIITGMYDQAAIEKAFAVGATDFIIKPIQWQVLAQRAGRLLNSSQMMKELQKQNRRSQLFADITLKIRQSLQIDETLQTSVTEVQKLLQADRVVILRMRSDFSVTVVKEAVIPGTMEILGRNIIDPCFQECYIEKYRQGHISAIDDIYTANIQPCHIAFLQQFGVRANLVVPIILQNQLWGLLIAHQCRNTRHWTEWETELLKQLADQMGIALAQGKLLEQETRQRQELIRSNQELQEFAFIASHDLQEPLRKIKTFGDRLKANCGDTLSPQGKDYLDRMQNAARRMQILIDDLLALSRVTTRAQPFIPVHLADIAQEVISDLEITIQQNNAQITVGELPTIDADPLQMRQLFQNLIVNALKFHHPQISPHIKIQSQIQSTPVDTIANHPEYWQIHVIDNGIGFEEKYLDRIFNVFQRLHGRSEYEGTGIGLAICRKIIEIHKGAITAISQPGKGATFIITLPKHHR